LLLLLLPLLPLLLLLLLPLRLSRFVGGDAAIRA
jgi:hypothetical protein